MLNPRKAKINIIIAQVVQLILLKKLPTLVLVVDAEAEADPSPGLGAGAELALPKISALSTFAEDDPKELNIELFEGFADGFIYNKNKYIKFL
jgi:hypothetical protein